MHELLVRNPHEKQFKDQKQKKANAVQDAKTEVIENGFAKLFNIRCN